MELRSYNVEKIYNAVVKCRIGDDIGVRKVDLYIWKDEIKCLVDQIARSGNQTILAMANLRSDGETWTPYLQIVEMLIVMGKKIGALSFEGKLKEDTKITFL